MDNPIWELLMDREHQRQPLSFGAYAGKIMKTAVPKTLGLLGVRWSAIVIVVVAIAVGGAVKTPEILTHLKEHPSKVIASFSNTQHDRTDWAALHAPDRFDGLPR
jgi:hypothetical protein